MSMDPKEEQAIRDPEAVAKAADGITTGAHAIIGKKAIEPFKKNGELKMTVPVNKAADELDPDKNRGGKRTRIKGEKVETISGCFHAGTRSFANRVRRRQKKRKQEKISRRKNRKK